MQTAPFFDTIAAAPQGASAFWVQAADTVRLRVGLLAPAPAEPKGTVLLFPGRTEYVEKYGPVAAALQARGFACLSIDWRGQGLSDRALDDLAIGHVSSFLDYQSDVAALSTAAEMLDLPAPFYLLAHSMGGSIGLRALHNGLPVRAVAFSGPMWGIVFPRAYRPIAPLLAAVLRFIGFGQNCVPSTKPESYTVTAPFEDNTLTSDREMFDWMRGQLISHPELALGCPSNIWLHQALKELRFLRNTPPPAVPCLTWVGSDEKIVDSDAIHRVMKAWPNGQLRVVPDAKHEVMMEKASIRKGFFDAIVAHFDAAT